MKIGQMMESKYIRKEDVDPPKLLTIVGFEKVNVAREDEQPEIKWVMKFREEKPLVMNSTNLQLAARAFGSEDTDDWLNKTIVAFNDPNVSYGGRLTGGVRLRAAKNQIKPTGAMPGYVEIEVEDDPTPF